ncbi:MAG TPA: hypothetical protein VN944_05975 [Nitrospiria bacterium]|nr:hypothetical protein [Nitrospiria bacterium]
MIDHLFDIGFLVLSQLAAGGVVSCLILDVQMLGKALFRTNGILFLLCMMAALALFSFNQTVPAHEGRWIFGLFLAFVFFLLVHVVTLWTGGEAWGRGALWAAAIAGLWGIYWSAKGYLVSGGHEPFLPWLIPLHFVVSALLMGSGMVGMNVGHCYLTKIHLPISPFRKLAAFFLLLLFIEGGIIALGLVRLNDPELIRKAIFLETFDGLFLWIRVLVGFIGPLVLAFMILHTIRIRSTQSATGLIFIAVMMVVAGQFFTGFFLLTGRKLL